MTAALSRNPGGSLQLTGDLTSQTARALFAQTPKFTGEPATIDLTAVGEVDSSGLALLLHWSNLSTAATGKLTYTNPPPQLRRMANISGVEGLLEE